MIKNWSAAMLLHEAGASTRDRGAPISISTHSEQRWSRTAAAPHSFDGRTRRHCSWLSRPAGARVHADGSHDDLGGSPPPGGRAGPC